MTRKPHIKHLFNKSGCLTLQALQDYITGTLTPAEQEAVKSHLASCMLCADAYEGLMLFKDKQNLANTINTLKEQVLEHAQARPVFRLKTFHKRSIPMVWTYTIAAAASIIILIGFSLLYFHSRNNPGRELAALPDTSRSGGMVLPGPSFQLHIQPQDTEIVMQEKEKKKDLDNKKEGGDGSGKETQIGGVKIPDSAGLNHIQPVTAEIQMIDSSMAEAGKTQSMREFLDAGNTMTRAKEEPAAVKTSTMVRSAGTDKDVQPGEMESEAPSQNMKVDRMPSFPGGDEALFAYLQDSLRYPTEAREKDIKGMVMVTFIVEKDGSLSEVKIAKGLGPALDEEAIRLVKSMPRWNPGEQHGEKVRVSCTLPIRF
jgi:TonB family protein